LNIIYQKVELDKVDVSEEYRMNMLVLYILVSLSKENYSYALILCERIKRIHSYRDTVRKEYIYYYFKATANMYIGNEEDAKKNALLCNERAIKMGKEYEIFMSMLLMNMSELSGWKDIWICDKDIKVSDKLIELCYKYRYLNHLAHIYVYCFDNDVSLYNKVEDVEIRTPNVTKGIWLANKLGNDKFLVEAYRKNIMVASINGYFDVAGHFYEKSIEVVKRSGNRMEEANIYNGLGYNSCTADEYNNANTYYSKALRIFYECKSSDYISETLYNLGTNAILAEDYKHATEYLMAVINILAILKKNSLRVCNISKIFGLIAIAYFKQGNIYTAQIYVNKSKNFLRYILEYCDADSYSLLWDDDMFMFFYVSALIDWKNGKIDRASEEFDKAEVYMRRNTGSKFFNFVHFARDKAKFLEKIGKQDEAKSLLREAKEYFKANGNPLRTNMFEELLTKGKWDCPVMDMSLKDITIEEIMEFIKLECIENDAKARRNHIRFFGTFQELINQPYHNVESQIDTLVINFKNNFKLDNLILINCENDSAKIRYSDLEYDISEEEINTILDYFKDNSSGFVLSKFDNNYYDYDKVVRIFDRSKVFSIVCVPIFRNEKLYSVFITFVKIPESWNSVIYRDALDNEDMELYTIVFRQILDAMEKYKLNERLIRQSVTDELTGLYNRKGYYEIVDRMIKNSRKKGKAINCTFMYLDLDHFKYYNDTFGHQVGDGILKKFAEIFSEACGDEGFVVRFGGDEFVMLLNTIDKDKINSIVKKIYDLIEIEDGFSATVYKYSNKKVYIPEDFRATCSIGVDIGENMHNISDMTELQKHADNALYNVKYSGRGRMMIYGE
jgi:diguanylate cyclase (GGDEF)-like protein